MKEIVKKIICVLLISALVGCGSNGVIETEKADYSDVLDEYRTYVESFDLSIREKSLIKGEYADDWGCEIIMVLSNRSKDDLGYALKDINSDGIEELFLLEKFFYDNKSHLVVCDIYSFSDGKPQFLGDFWYRSVCVRITKDGTIYRRASGGAAISDFTSYRIADDRKSLNVIDSLEREYKPDDIIEDYRLDDDGKQIGMINESEADEIIAQFDITSDNIIHDLEFIPII